VTDETGCEDWRGRRCPYPSAADMEAAMAEIEAELAGREAVA
jgi:hypothetical protein